MYAGERCLTWGAAEVAGDWVHLPHGADIGVRGRGASLAAAFAAAAEALTAIVTDLATVRPVTAVAVRVEAPDDELLLVDWLNALIFEMDTRGMLFSRFEVRIADHRLDATAWGEPVDAACHRPAVEAKGATYTGLEVRHAADGQWTAQCVIDV